ncbi:MAG TPA: Rossmann-like and DUF2520 domain-containing protein [Candidatus Acidoferrales bacterium]
MQQTIALVGAGRVGRALGRRLRQLGWRIGAVVTQSRRTARAAVRVIGAGRAIASPAVIPSRDGVGTRDLHLVLEADVVLICTPDARIAGVAAQLAALGDRRAWRGKVVLHSSGALSSSVLAPLVRRGAATGSLHLMQTFSGRGVPEFRGINCAIEGHPRAQRVARGIAKSLGGVAVGVPAGARPEYHLAGGFAAQHLLTLIETGVHILRRLGIPRRRAVKALVTMARQSLANLESSGGRASLTGPVARGDFTTIERHAGVLRRYPREYRELYSLLTRVGVGLLLPRPAPTLRRLERILAALRKRAPRKKPR